MCASRGASALLVVLALAVVSTASGRLLQQASTTTTAPTPEPTPMPGGDRDEHGCIPSAGFQWCEATQECYRSWENECPGNEDDTPVLPFLGGTGPVIPPEEEQSGDDEHGADLPTAGQCPGEPGLMGGWTLQADPANDASVQAAAQVVANALGLSNQSFEVTTACTQVVAGVNYYLQLNFFDEGNATATVYQPLGADAAMEITSMDYDGNK